MRRNRVLLIFALMLAMSLTIVWLNAVLAATTLNLNEGITVDEGSSGIIDNTMLQVDDPDSPGATITYSLVTTPANGMLSLDGGTTPLTPTGQFNQSDIDNHLLSYIHNDSETLSDSFEFTVTSGNGVIEDTFLITINPIFDQNPMIDDQIFSVDENSPTGTPVGIITATDEDAGDSLAFTIIGGNFDSPFSLSITGAIAVDNPAPLDFEINQILTFTVQVEDLGALKDTATITVNVNNVNEAPTVNDDTFTVPENSNVGTAIGIVTATDPENDPLTFAITSGNTGDTFAINETTGQITVTNNSLLNFEALGSPPHFILTVEVDDGELKDEATITINVTDVNEPPVILLPQTFTIAENSANGTAVGTVTATDPENQPLQYEILTLNAPFGIHPSTGLITVTNSTALNYEVTPSFTLSIRVTDNGQLGDGTPGQPILSHTADITINLLDVNESPSVNNATFSIAEDSPNGTVVGTVIATDPDAGDSLTYTITGGNTPGTPFAINASTGQITVNDTTQLNTAVKEVYNLTVQVQDTGGRMATATITINVTPRPITTIFLPLLLNNYPPVEPNNNCSEAYPIGSGINYQFVADDQEDWYVFTLANPGNLTVTLSNFTPSQGQLLVYSGVCGGTLTLLQNNGSPGTTKIINLTNRSAGTYYIRVYSVPANNSNYNLRVN